MIFFNNKMKAYLDIDSNRDVGELENLSFIQLGSGFFFDREVNENVKTVVKTYSANRDSDWAGFEFGTNKLHLEDELRASIPDVTAAGIYLTQRLADRFKTQFPDIKAVFWLGCDELGEYPSVTLSFYVRREGMLPLLPEDEAALNSFPTALMMVL